MKFYKVTVSFSIANCKKYSLLTLAGACINRGVTATDFENISNMKIGHTIFIDDLEVERVS